ncbi:MAG: DUF4129 domain-containing protein [Planctomycetota bacterium]
MRPEDLAVELRPRTAWEAVDLGQSMWRRWWLPVNAAWSATFVPVAVGLGAVLDTRPFLVLVVLWWLLPLFERGPVLVLGRLVFGGRTTALDFLRELPTLWGRRVLWRMFLARFSPWRGFLAPVAVLERLGGSTARRRAATLAGGGGESSVAIAVAVVCWSIQIGLFVVFVYGVPALGGFADVGEEAYTALFGAPGDAAPWARAYVLVAGALAMSVVGPIHAATSFALYLNRRTYLEGWDVEVAFRSLVRRAAGARRTRMSVGLVLLVAVALASFSSPARAGVAPQESQDARTVAREILSGPEFDTTEVQRVPVRRGPRPVPSSGGGGLLLGEIARILVVGVGVALVLGLVYLALKHRDAANVRLGPSPVAPPVVVAGLDVRPESLPDDPVREARELWRTGRSREALSLLYRASIVALVRERGVPIVDGDTEGDCVRRVARSTDDGVRRPFSNLTRAWQACAYGEIVPRDAEFESLCAQWRGVFGGAA